MPAKSRYISLTTTVDSRQRAQALARRIVNSRLAACVQTMPIRSVYHWKGSVETAEEFLLIVKTRATLTQVLVNLIRSVHAYELPEIVVTPITGGLKEYLDWIGAETSSLRPARKRP